jgi:hypothetical protein
MICLIKIRIIQLSMYLSESGVDNEKNNSNSFDESFNDDKR